jgi:hypothetical protein
MKARPACAVLLLLTVFVCRGQSGALQLPEPPRQHAAWRPDASIPTNILSAVEALYAQGFPDPRGCDYREIEVAVSGVWGGKVSLVKTRGWVLPEKSGTNQFAICWNGLIYPVANISAPADLHAEISNSNAPAAQRFGFGGVAAVGEERSIIYANSLSTRVLLLLRCGETAAALTNWSPNQRMMMSGGGGGGRVRSNDPYLEFAGDWAWAMFDRIICAHMRGDEALALATARQLAGVQPKIEAECAARGFPRQQYYDNQHRGQERPYLDFLDQLPQLLADLERRAKEGSRVSVIESGLQNITNQTGRVAALIRDLDLVAARQWSQPGWVNLPEDPIVSALIQEGDPAVEPLLDCVDHDKRLTRSVGFGRDFFRSRTVIPVSDAAMVAVKSILQAGFGDGTAEIRAYWNKYKGMKLEERWYAILNDDSTGSRWGEAASHIIQPDNVTTFTGGFSMIKQVPTNTPVRMRGEILRGKSDPSVAELMARRALEVPTNNPNAYDLTAACQMALCLAAWDPPAALSVARTLSKRACTVMKYSAQQLGTLVTKLAMARANAGDPQAFDDYADWIITTTSEQQGFPIRDCLDPLQKFPTNQILQAAAEKMFADTNSAWGRLPWKGMNGDNPIGSDLVNVPAFRRLLVRELEKTNVCGSFTWREPDAISYEIANYQSGSYGAIAFPSWKRPANGTSSELRWCDWVAFSLSIGKHIPFFNPFAPVAERDEAIEKAKTLLEQP